MRVIASSSIVVFFRCLCVQHHLFCFFSALSLIQPLVVFASSILECVVLTLHIRALLFFFRWLFFCVSRQLLFDYLIIFHRFYHNMFIISTNILIAGVNEMTSNKQRPPTPTNILHTRSHLNSYLIASGMIIVYEITFSQTLCMKHRQ